MSADLRSAMDSAPFLSKKAKAEPIFYGWRSSRPYRRALESLLASDLNARAASSTRPFLEGFSLHAGVHTARQRPRGSGAPLRLWGPPATVAGAAGPAARWSSRVPTQAPAPGWLWALSKILRGPQRHQEVTERWLPV